MSEFDDLFEPQIPREVAIEFVEVLAKLAAPPEDRTFLERQWDKGNIQTMGFGPLGSLLGGSEHNNGRRTLGALAGHGAGRLASEGLGLNGTLAGLAAVRAGEVIGNAIVAEATERKKSHGSIVNMNHPLIRTRAKAAAAEMLGRPLGTLRKLAADDSVPPELVVMQEQQGLLQQATLENDALRGELEESQALIQEHAQSAEQAQAAAEQGQQELAMAQQQAAQVQQQATQAMATAQQYQTEAQVHAQNAAQQSDAKARLAVRIQQLRQGLMDLATPDPVSEEGEQAQPPQTATQQGADPNADPTAQQDPNAAAAQGQEQAPPGAEQAQQPAQKAAALVKAARGGHAARERVRRAISSNPRAKEKGVGRALQLVTGNRLDALKSKGTSKGYGKGLHKGRAAKDEISAERAKVWGSRAAAATVPAALVANEVRKVGGAFDAAGRAHGLAGVGKTLKPKALKMPKLAAALVERAKQAKEKEPDDRLYRGARNTATALGAAQGATLANAAGVAASVLSKGKKRPKSLLRQVGESALLSGTGGVAGGSQSRLKFDRDEMVKDLASNRALRKERFSRLDKAQEKEASAEDLAIDRMFGLI